MSNNTVLTTTINPVTTTTTSIPCCDESIYGYVANKLKILVQKVEGNERPDPSKWRSIDYTDLLTPTMIDGFITETGMTSNTFVITKELYDRAGFYDLSDYINLPLATQQNRLGFGDEYYFYGNIETDIQGTIYEMRYDIGLNNGQFEATSNPTWDQSVVPNPYMTEIGLYDEDKNLLVINKFESPIVRKGKQFFQIKIDF